MSLVELKIPFNLAKFESGRKNSNFQSVSDFVKLFVEAFDVLRSNKFSSFGKDRNV